MIRRGAVPAFVVSGPLLPSDYLIDAVQCVHESRRIFRKAL